MNGELEHLQWETTLRKKYRSKRFVDEQVYEVLLERCC